MSRIKIFLLGPPRVELDGVPIEVDTRKATALVAYLAVTGEGHRRDSLAALLWPDVDQTRARAALRRTLSSLNKALGGVGLKVDRESMRMDKGENVWIDVDEFRAGLAECESHGHKANQVCSRCITPLSKTVALYQDDLMKGFTLRDSPDFDDWQFFEAESLRRELAHALGRLAEGYQSRDEFGQAIDYTRRWLALDTLDESAHRQLMDLFSRAGQRSAALRQYRECVRILDQELGVAPLEETTRLYQDIRENQTPPARIESRRTVGEIEAEGSSADRGVASVTPPHSYPVVGRSDEWAILLNAYNAVETDGHVLVIEGEAGIGKTRLAQEFIAHSQERGAIVISIRCYQGESGMAYAPIVEALRKIFTLREVGPSEEISQEWISEAARLLPELHTLRQGMSSPLPLDSPGAQARFFEAVSHILVQACQGQAPGILFFDDLHWADEATLDLLTYMVRRVRGRPLFIVATWRTDRVVEGHRLRLLLAEAQRSETATLITLERLSLSAVAELLNGISTGGMSVPVGLEKRLYSETDGLPFFVVEYLKTVTENPETDWDMPKSVRALLLSRLAVLNQAERQLLDTAAVIGRSFDYHTLQAASGRGDEETVDGLEELITQSLINEVRATGSSEASIVYDFDHEQLRSLVYEEASLARRSLLHRRVADALVGRASGGRRKADTASLVAQHYRLAGLNIKASEYFKFAGNHARALFANIEAIAHFRSALELGHEDVASLHEGIGDLQVLQGDYGAALMSYETTAAHCNQEDMARIERKLGAVHHRRGEWALAESHLQAALDFLGKENTSVQLARLYSDWSLTAHHRGDAGRAQSMAKESLDLAEEIGDKRALTEVHNILGILARGRHSFDEAVYHLEFSLNLAEKLGDPSARVAALNNLALALGDKGEIVQAISLAGTALDLCASQGDRHREAAIHNNLADLLHVAGESGTAMAHLKQAVTIFAEIGVEAGEMQPDIWKLVEW